MSDQPLDWVNARIEQGRVVVHEMLNCQKHGFQNMTPSILPDEPGIYVISERETGKILRAGKTEDQTLRNRIYRNHLMGNQPGNLRAQLVKSGLCNSLDDAKRWIRSHCVVQFLESRQLGLEIRWAEHFLLAVLRPKFSD